MSKLFRPAAALLALSAAALVSAALPTEAHADFVRVPSPTPVDASLNGVAAVSAANVWAVGTRTGVGTLALNWDGSRWRIAATPLSATPFAGLEDVAATSATDVWAVGESDGDSALILHNDGRGW